MIKLTTMKSKRNIKVSSVENLEKKNLYLKYKGFQKIDRDAIRSFEKIKDDPELMQFDENLFKCEMEKICNGKNSFMFLSIMKEINKKKQPKVRKRIRKKSVTASPFSQKKINFYFNKQKKI
tara:strand:+ start:160 stop:525 length:366 start_codon:yes stop_codon:yes gene_type:complete